MTQRHAENDVTHYAGTFEPEYNVLTHNSFTPLGNFDNGEEDNLFAMSQAQPLATYELGYPGQSGNYPQPNWGFPRATQGTKRLAELKEGLEGDNILSPKRSKM